MTTTTPTTSVTAPINTTSARPSDVPATDIVQGAEPEPRESGHVDTAPTGSASARTAEDSERAHRLVWLDPQGLAVHPRNIRDDLGDLSGLPIPSPPRVCWRPSP